MQYVVEGQGALSSHRSKANDMATNQSDRPFSGVQINILQQPKDLLKHSSLENSIIHCRSRGGGRGGGGAKYNVRFLHQIGQLYLEPRNVLTYCKLLPPLLLLLWLLPFKSQVARAKDRQQQRLLACAWQIRREQLKNNLSKKFSSEDFWLKTKHTKKCTYTSTVLLRTSSLLSGSRTQSSFSGCG